MDENRVDEFLEHHGIKGQKWSIRRTPEQLGKRAQDFYDSYKSTPIGVLDSAKETVDKGRQFVADLLENAADTIRPKKK